MNIVGSPVGRGKQSPGSPAGYPNNDLAMPSRRLPVALADGSVHPAGWSDDRGAEVLIEDFEGVLRAVPDGVLAYEGSRVIHNLFPAGTPEEFDSTDAHYATSSGGIDNGDGSVTLPAGEKAYTRLTTSDGVSVANRDIIGYQEVKGPPGRTVWVRYQGDGGVSYLPFAGDLGYFEHTFSGEWEPLCHGAVTEPHGQNSIRLYLLNGAGSSDLTFRIRKPMLHYTGVANKAPHRYVPPGKCVCNIRENASSYDAQGNVTFADGPVISPKPELTAYPKTLNEVHFSSDATQWSTLGDATASVSTQRIAGVRASTISGQTAAWHGKEALHLSQTGKYLFSVYLAAGTQTHCRVTCKDDTAGEANTADFTIGDAAVPHNPGNSIMESIEKRQVPGGWRYTFSLTPATDGNNCRYRVGTGTSTETDTLLVAGAQASDNVTPVPLVETDGSATERGSAVIRAKRTERSVDSAEGTLVLKVRFDDEDSRPTSPVSGIFSVRDSTVSLMYFGNAADAKFTATNGVTYPYRYAAWVAPAERIAATVWSKTKNKFQVFAKGTSWAASTEREFTQEFQKNNWIRLAYQTQYIMKILGLHLSKQYRTQSQVEKINV